MAELHDIPGYAHAFRMRDERGWIFWNHGSIWLLELRNFHADGVKTEEQRWLKFFNEAEHREGTGRQKGSDGTVGKETETVDVMGCIA